LVNPQFGTAQAANTEEIISVTRVQQILNSNVVEVQNLCRKASLRPRKDELGNVYFSKSDVDVLKKVKELYEHTKLIQEMKKREEPAQATPPPPPPTLDPNTSQNILARAKARLRNEVAAPIPPQRERPTQYMTQPPPQYAEAAFAKLQGGLTKLEENILARMNELLSEKMDGLDEVILELIRSKTENETLRARLNDLNRENFNLKSEVANYKPVALGFYVKKGSSGF